MKRRQFLLGAAAAITGAPAWSAPRRRFERGVLWRMGTHGVAPSHVYGTIHVPDARLAVLPAEVRKAFDAARSLMLESLPDAYASARFLEAAMFLDGQTLEEKIGARDFERALEHLAPTGLTRQFVNRLKPWGVLLNLQNPKGADGAPLDSQLLALARARRMPLHQIEGLEERIFAFDEFPRASQVALLEHSLKYHSELIELWERTVEAYLAGDLAGMWQLRGAFVARHPGIAPHQAVMTKRLLHDRNVVMAFRMQRELRRGNAFVALGALHLYGEKGVLARLAEDGYRAAQVL